MQQIFRCASVWKIFFLADGLGFFHSLNAFDSRHPLVKWLLRQIDYANRGRTAFLTWLFIVRYTPGLRIICKNIVIWIKVPPFMKIVLFKDMKHRQELLSQSSKLHMPSSIFYVDWVLTVLSQIFSRCPILWNQSSHVENQTEPASQIVEARWSPNS
jgi:hypothetical protein